MSATSKIMVGVASGYLLGRNKKLKLPINVGSMLAGQRVATNPQALLAQGAKLVEKNPELQKLQSQISDKLLEAAKAAAITAATQRLEGLSRSLQAQKSGGEEDSPEDEDEADDQPEDEADDQGEDLDEDEDEPEDEADDEPEDAADD